MQEAGNKAAAADELLHQLYADREQIRHAGAMAAMAAPLFMETPIGRWNTNDYDTFEYATPLEDDLAMVVESGAVRPEYRQTLTNSIREYRCSLPYTEAELSWLRWANDAALRARPVKQGSDHLPDLREMEGDIISVGRECHVNGKEMLDRWWSWRRGRDGYSKRANFNAYMALYRIGRLLTDPLVLF